jgi:hypothetical protein
MEFNSQAGQDIFVYDVMKRKTDGTFMEIGGHDPKYINNTYVLEQIGWTGFSFDIDHSLINKFKQARKCKFICADLTIFDWDKFLIDNDLVNKTIDYLSFDIDEASLPALEIFPFDKIKFNVMTVEHDSYRFGDHIANKMREIICKHGYQILCKNVKNQSFPYEDWYVHTDYLNLNSTLERYRCSDEDWKTITQTPYAGQCASPPALGPTA